MDKKPAFNFNAGMTPNFNFGAQGNAAEVQQVSGERMIYLVKSVSWIYLLKLGRWKIIIGT